jgi:hypothetical protein
MEVKLHHLYAISELIAQPKVTHPDRHVCYCRLLQLSCLSVGIVPGCGHVVQLAGQWNHFARDLFFRFSKIIVVFLGEQLDINKLKMMYCPK